MQQNIAKFAHTVFSSETFSTTPPFAIAYIQGLLLHEKLSYCLRSTLNQSVSWITCSRSSFRSSARDTWLSHGRGHLRLRVKSFATTCIGFSSVTNYSYFISYK